MLVLVRLQARGAGVRMLMLRSFALVSVFQGHGATGMLRPVRMLVRVLVAVGVRVLMGMHQVAVPMLVAVSVGVNMGVRMLMCLLRFHSFSLPPSARPRGQQGLTPRAGWPNLHPETLLLNGLPHARIGRRDVTAGKARLLETSGTPREGTWPTAVARKSTGLWARCPHRASAWARRQAAKLR